MSIFEVQACFSGLVFQISYPVCVTLAIEVERPGLKLPIVRNDDAETPSLDRDLRANASTKKGVQI